MASSQFSLAPLYGTPVNLPLPRRGYEETPERIGSSQTTLAGARVVQTVAVKTTFTLGFEWLTDGQYAVLLGFFNGSNGPGPFELRRSGEATVWQVNIVSLSHKVPLAGRHDCDLVLAQV